MRSRAILAKFFRVAGFKVRAVIQSVVGARPAAERRSVTPHEQDGPVPLLRCIAVPRPLERDRRVVAVAPRIAPPYRPASPARLHRFSLVRAGLAVKIMPKRCP